jgi:hypothetical protein
MISCLRVLLCAAVLLSVYSAAADTAIAGAKAGAWQRHASGRGRTGIGQGQGLGQGSGRVKAMVGGSRGAGAGESAYVGEGCCSGQSLLVPVTPGMGLVNQIVTWSNGIAMGIKLRRNICIMGFGTDVIHDNMHTFHFSNREEWVLNTTIGAHLIFDFEELNRRLSGMLGGLKICSASLREQSDATTCVLGDQGGNDWDGWCQVLIALKEYNKRDWNASHLVIAGDKTDIRTYNR